MDLEYVRYLMLYSDKKYPFEMAKSDPGLTESVRSVKRFLKKNGESRKLNNDEANEILLNERNAYRQVRDIDEEYTPKAEKTLNEIERSMAAQPPQNDLEKEIAMLKKQLQDKEAELRLRSTDQSPSKNVWSGMNFENPPTPKPQNGHDGIIERRLEDTGYSDKVNNE